jgi:hypothetical protein
MNPSSARGSQLRIVVGFDFGTHSTKVIYRYPKHDTTVSRVLCFDKLIPGYPSFASPSLIRLSDGCLWFGSEALRKGGGHLYQNLKVRLLDEGKERSLQPFPSGPTPMQLAAAYFAWAFQRTRAMLWDEFGSYTMRLNLAAPMNHIENPKLLDIYLRIVQAAWATVFERGIDICQGIKADLLLQPLAQSLEAPPGDPSERYFEVLPETIAPIASMSLDSSKPPGIYLVIDMGGATTELSVNRVVKSTSGIYVHCHWDDVIDVGGNDFAALEGIPSQEADARQKVLLDQTSRTMKEVWYKGFCKDKDGPRCVYDDWKKLRVLLAGGGTRHPRVMERIDSSPPQDCIFPHIRCQYQIDRYTPANIELREPDRTDSADLSLLAVAHGLAQDAQRWPEFLKPIEVQEYDRRQPPDPPDPYWYVGGK